MVFGGIGVLMTISGLLVGVLGYRCPYPVPLPMSDMSEHSQPTQLANMPIYCGNPTVIVVKFVFEILSVLVLSGAGLYMMMSGKKR